MSNLKTRSYTDQDDSQLLHRRMLTAIVDEHDKIRKIALLTSLQRGTLPLEQYVLYLATLYHIYAPLEQVVKDKADHEVLQPLVFPELIRLPSIEADLAFYIGQVNIEKWVAATVTPSTIAWRERLYELATIDNCALLPCIMAHIYTRYMGDLAGGQILLKRVAAMYHLPEGEGVNFYEFRLIPQTNYFKDLFCKTMNNIGDDMDEDMKDKIVEEVKHSFQMNFNILEELQGFADTIVFPTPLLNSISVHTPLLSKTNTLVSLKPTSSLVMDTVDTKATIQKKSEMVSSKSLQCPLRMLPITPRVSGPLMVLGLAVLGFTVSVHGTPHW